MEAGPSFPCSVFALGFRLAGCRDTRNDYCHLVPVSYKVDELKTPSLESPAVFIDDRCADVLVIESRCIQDESLWSYFQMMSMLI